MELVFERSIREHRERMAAGAKKSKPQPSPEKPPTTDKKPVKVEPAPEKPKGAGRPKPTPMSPFLAMMSDLELNFGSGTAKSTKPH